MNDTHSDPWRVQIAEWRTRLVQPWFVAGWSGMGVVAQLAISYLAGKLGARPLGELPAETFFDLRAVEVERGLIQAPRLAKNTLFGWKNPAGGRDLLLFEGGLQPQHEARRFCEELVALVREFGAIRVCTFAAMATMIRPEAHPRVFVAASDIRLLDEVGRLDAEPLTEGSIGGLNGLLVEVAKRRGLGGLCLLGEMPYFASGIANPKASAAVLRTFTRLAGVEVDLADLDAHAATVEHTLVEHLRRAEKAAAALQQAVGAESGSPAAGPPDASGRERDTKLRIEELFGEAKRDRNKVAQLKAELDRHGLFREYQDRFLDLFKRAE